MLGLAARAGALAPGTPAVRQANREGRVRFAIVASDLTATGRDKLVPSLEGRGVPYAVRYTKTELGVAVGRAPLAAVGIVEAGFADRLRTLLADGEDRK